MTFFDLLSLAGGIALFLYGISTMGDGLARLSGAKLEKLLERLTSTRLMAITLGLTVTAVVQSSAATTIMVVGFVNSGIMKLSRAVGIIMGANIGTTATGWILSLSGIQGENFFLQLLKPSSFSPVLALVGVIMIMTAKKENQKDVGHIIVGFALLMIGMNMMSSAMEPLSQEEGFQRIMIMFENPLLGLIVGFGLTVIVQSSSASVGILQALSITGAVNFATAIPVIMGQNIGGCIATLISSIGAGSNAKRAALVHLYFNITGTVMFTVVFYTLNAFLHFEFMSSQVSPVDIAILHSTFNIVTATVLFPFADILEKAATVTIKDKKGEGDNGDVKDYSDDSALDDRFLNMPGFAMEICRGEAVRMARMSKDAAYLAMDVIQGYLHHAFKQDDYDKVVYYEQRIDKFEDDLGTYLVKLGGSDLSASDGRTQSILLHCMGDFERISDHAVNLLESLDEMRSKNLFFSDEATEELNVMMDAVKKIVRRSAGVFEEQDLERAAKVEPLEKVIDELAIEIRQRHIIRLRDGRCTIELGFILSDMVTLLERIADHCAGIAVSIIQVNDNSYDTHEYLDIIKNQNNELFNEKFQKYQNRYKLPYIDYGDDEEDD